MNKLMGVFLPQRNSDMYILEIFTKRQTHTHVSERHQHKPHLLQNSIQFNQSSATVPIISEKEKAPISWDFRCLLPTQHLQKAGCVCAAPLPSLALICSAPLRAEGRALAVLPGAERTGNPSLLCSLPSPHSGTAHPAALHKLLGGYLKTDAQKAEENKSPKSSAFLSLIRLMLLTLR